MAGPWEKYQGEQPAAQPSGPWEKYGGSQPAPATSFSEEHGITNPIAKGALDAVEGVGSGVLSTVFHGGDLVRRALGMNRVIDKPEVKGLMSAPSSIPGKVGKFAEQAAEFAVPGGIASKATRGMGLIPRLAAEAGTAGTVGAVQSGGDLGATASATVAGAAGPVLGATAEAIGNSRLPQKLYQSALKPTWSMAKKNGLEMLDTGLKEQIPVSAEGMSIVEGKIKNLQKQISDGIQQNAAKGRTVDSSKVLASLDDLEDFYKNTAAPKKSLETLQAIRDQFTQYHGQQIPLDKAQQIKINTYQELKQAYGEMASAKVEGLKQVTRGLKEQIESVFPEVKGLNEQQSKLLDLDGALHRAVWRIENHQMMGIGSPLAAAGGHAIMGGPGAAVGFVGKLLLDDPTIKSKLAIKLAQAGVKNPNAVIGTRLTALQGMLEKGASEAGIREPSARYQLPNAADATDPGSQNDQLALSQGRR